MYLHEGLRAKRAPDVTGGHLVADKDEVSRGDHGLGGAWVKGRGGCLGCVEKMGAF